MYSGNQQDHAHFNLHHTWNDYKNKTGGLIDPYILGFNFHFWFTLQLGGGGKSTTFYSTTWPCVSSTAIILLRLVSSNTKGIQTPKGMPLTWQHKIPPPPPPPPKCLQLHVLGKEFYQSTLNLISHLKLQAG